MSVGTFLSYVLLVLVVGMALIALIVYAVVHVEEIKQGIHDFFENRSARKIAKKLGFVDKGKVASTTKRITNSGGEIDYETYHEVHVFCQKQLRIGVSKGKSVKWCATCEQIGEEDSGGSGGNGGKKPPLPIDPTPPEVIKETNELLQKLIKQSS